MPTYEYRCPDGHQFERFYRKISDAAAEVACPECGKLAVRQLSGGAGFLFKGSGFYLTDYGKNAHRKTGPDSAAEGSRGSREGSESGQGAGATGEAGGTKASDSAGESKAGGGKASEPKSSDKKQGTAGSGGSTPATTSAKPASGRSSSPPKSEK